MILSPCRQSILGEGGRQASHLRWEDLVHQYIQVPDTEAKKAEGVSMAVLLIPNPPV